MNGILHLRRDDPMPLWVELLEESAFGEPWGPLEPNEHLLLIAPHAFIRWCAIRAANEAELLRIAVAPEARRQGLARKLMLASETFLLDEGIDNLYLEVRTSNLPARSLYEALGWRMQRLRKAYYRDGEDAVIYWKQLGTSHP
jgi:ribosomal protein S18 acetylase RimI-like enzyme